MKKLAILCCCVGLLIACSKKDKSAKKVSQDPAAMPAAMEAMRPVVADTMRPVAVEAMRPVVADTMRPVAMGPTGTLVTIAGVTPEQDKVTCGWGSCEVGVITARAKAEIEKQKDFTQLKIKFRKGSTNEHFTTLVNLPWVRRLVIDSTQIVDLVPVKALVELEEFSARNLKLPKQDKKEIPLDLAPFKGASKLKSLQLYGTKVQNAQVLAGVRTLVKISFYMSDTLEIGFVKDLTNLVELDLYACHTTSIAALAGLTKLRKLNLYMNKSTDFSPLKGLVNLEELWLQFTTIKDLGVLAGMTRMKRLYLNWAKEISDVSPLAKMVDLEYLDVSSKKVTDLSVVAKFSKLSSFSAGGTQIKTIAFLKGHTALTSVNISHTKVRDLRPLSSAKKLYSLRMHGTKVKSLAPLMKLEKLGFLTVSKGFAKGQLKRIKKKFPKLRLHEQ